ncbi:hypothetical protein D9M69_683680 [compost metagenome]
MASGGQCLSTHLSGRSVPLHVSAAGLLGQLGIIGLRVFQAINVRLALRLSQLTDLLRRQDKSVTVWLAGDDCLIQRLGVVSLGLLQLLQLAV